MVTTDKIMEMIPLVLHPSDVSESLGVSIDYARALFRSGKIPVIIIGKRRVITQASFIEWLERKIISDGRR